MPYMDIFVAPVPSSNRITYQEHAEKAADLFKEHGAVSVTECWGTDVPEGKLTSFTKAVALEEGETVVAGFVMWTDKASRDAAWEKVMADERMAGPMPFDGKRMIFGGFETLFEK